MAWVRSLLGTHFKINVFALYFVLAAFFSLPRQVYGQMQTDMKMFTDSFISPDFEATQKNNYQFVGATLRSDPYAEDFLKMDISGGVAMGAPLMNYLNITELYFQNHQSTSESYFIGRKKLLWSELDARWNLGLWQPVFKWNPLAPEEQGLSGLFWQLDKPLLTFVLFVSPVYLPSQGPSFEIQDGDFVKGNPWFHQPPQSVRIWDQATAMQYHFQRPNDSQIVMQNSYGARMVFGDPQGLRAQLSYLYSPDNVLALGYKGSLDLATQKGNVELQPQVFFHSLAGADLTYKVKKIRLGFSGVYDRPTRESLFEKEWSQPRFQDAVLLSSFMDWDLGVLTVGLARLDVLGGQVEEVGENLANTPLTALYPFQQANQISMISDWRIGRGQKLVSKLSYTQSDKNDFQLIRFNSRYHYSNSWTFFGEMQILKAGHTDKNNVNDIAQFANNDRCMLGVAYAL